MEKKLVQKRDVVNKCRFQGKRNGGPNKKQALGAVDRLIRSVTLGEGTRACTLINQVISKSVNQFAKIQVIFTEIQNLF